MFDETGSISRPDGFQQLFAHIFPNRLSLGHSNDEIRQEDRPHDKAVQNQVKQAIVNDHVLVSRNMSAQPQNLDIAWFNKEAPGPYEAEFEEWDDFVDRVLEWLGRT